MSTTRKDTAAYKFFELLTQKYGLDKSAWNPFAMMACNQAVLRDNEDIKEFYLGMNLSGGVKSSRGVKHYRRRKRWLG